MAPIAPGGELFIVTASAVDPVCLGTKLFIHKGFATRSAQEACFMPMFVLVRQILKSKIIVSVALAKNKNTASLQSKKGDNLFSNLKKRKWEVIHKKFKILR